MSDDRTMSASDEDEPEHDPRAKMKAVLSYWKSVTKDDRTLSKFDVGFLEHKILSWSIQDVFNKDLLKQQVSDRAHCMHLSACIALRCFTSIYRLVYLW
jgi:senataxin